MKILMLPLKGRATPFAYQVPDPVYEKFKAYQDHLEVSHFLIEQIDVSCRIHTDRLMKSIQKWKTKTLKELDIHERREKAETLAGSIFA